MKLMQRAGIKLVWDRLPPTDEMDAVFRLIVGVSLVKASKVAVLAKTLLVGLAVVDELVVACMECVWLGS